MSDIKQDINISQDVIQSNKLIIYQSYFILFLLGLFIVFLRSAYNIIVPSIYAEDGSWTSLFIQKGLLYTLLHARPDYFVSGNILGLYTAYILNKIIFGYDIGNLPVFIAFVQYVFFSLTALLPVIVFRRHVNKFILILMWLSVLLVPLSFQGYEVFGKISNIGYLFYFIAFCLLFYRIVNRNILSKQQVILIDILLLICCTTNPGSYILLLLGGIIDIYSQKQELFNFKNGFCIKELFYNFIHRFSNKSWMILGILCIIILVYHFFFQANAARNILSEVELHWIGLIIRLTIFPLIYPFYHLLNDTYGFILIFITILYLIYTFIKGDRKEKYILLSLLGVFLIYAFILVYGRAETAKWYQYSNTGPDRYVYAINIQFMILFFYSLSIHFKVNKIFNKFIILFMIGLFFSTNIYSYKNIFQFSNSETFTTHVVTFKERIYESFFQTKFNNIDSLIRVKNDPPDLHFNMDLPAKYLLYTVFKGSNFNDGISLYDITDNNWNHGVANFDKSILLFSRKNYDILNNSKELVTYDNGKEYKAKILNMRREGIYVYAYTDLESADKFAYPAKIKYVIKDELNDISIYNLTDGHWKSGVNINNKNILLLGYSALPLMKKIKEIKVQKNNKEYTAKILDIQKHGDYIHVITDMADASVFAYPAKIQYTLK